MKVINANLPVPQIPDGQSLWIIQAWFQDYNDKKWKQSPNGLSTKIGTKEMILAHTKALAESEKSFFGGISGLTGLRHKRVYRVREVSVISSKVYTL